MEFSLTKYGQTTGNEAKKWKTVLQEEGGRARNRGMRGKKRAQQRRRNSANLLKRKTKFHLENIPILSLPGRFQKIRFQDERIRIHFMDAESRQFFIQIREHELGKFKCGLVSLGFKRDGIDMGQNCVYSLLPVRPRSRRFVSLGRM